MKILITGSEGYIGRSVVACLKLYYPRCRMVLCDSKLGTRAEQMYGEYDVVIHLAASTSVCDGENNKSEYIINNVNNTVHLLHNVEFKRFVFASTNAIYSSNGTLNPSSVYGASKLACEKYIESIVDLPKYRNREYVILRIANPVGLANYHKDLIPQLNTEASVFFKLAQCSLEKREFKIHNVRGMYRDFIPLSRLAEAIVLCSTDETTEKLRVYHASSGRKTMIVPLLKSLCSEFGIRYKLVPPPSGVDRGFLFPRQDIMPSMLGQNYQELLSINFSSVLSDYIRIMEDSR